MDIEAPEAAAEVRKARDVEAYGKVAQVFYAYDTDGSGFLEEAEVLEFCNSLGLEFAHPRAALDEMEDDATRDGMVSLEEFVAWWNKQTPTKIQGIVSGTLAKAREAGVKPKELEKLKKTLTAGDTPVGDGPLRRSSSGVNPGGIGAAALWRRAGNKTIMQLAVVDAFKDTTGKRPSDEHWKEWAFRDWPVWQCGKRITDLAEAERRARKSIKVYAAAVLPTAIVLGLLAIRTGFNTEEHPSCVHHSVSRITRLTEIGWLWIIGSSSLGLGVYLEIFSRKILASYISRERQQMNEGSDGAPRAHGGPESAGSVRCSAVLKLSFTVTAFLGSACYFVLICYALTLITLMADVCEGNFWPLAGYVVLLWLWLAAALFTGVPMACFTWLRWHGCSTGDAQALLYPTRYPVPPVPSPPPPVVRRLPAEARETGGANDVNSLPSPPTATAAVRKTPPPPLDDLVVNRGRQAAAPGLASVRLMSPTRRQRPSSLVAAGGVQPPPASSGSQVMMAARRIERVDTSVMGTELRPGARAKPPPLESFSRSGTPPRRQPPKLEVVSNVAP